MGVPSGPPSENNIALLISNFSLASGGTFGCVDVLFCWLVRFVRMQRTLADAETTATPGFSPTRAAESYVYWVETFCCSPRRPRRYMFPDAIQASLCHRREVDATFCEGLSVG